MRYALLVFQDEHHESSAVPMRIPGDPVDVVVTEDHWLRAGAAATTVRWTPNGVTLTDETFREGPTQLRRLCIVQAADLDGALRSATPLARSCAGVEIRPLGRSR